MDHVTHPHKWSSKVAIRKKNENLQSGAGRKKMVCISQSITVEERFGIVLTFSLIKIRSNSLNV